MSRPYKALSMVLCIFVGADIICPYKFYVSAVYVRNCTAPSVGIVGGDVPVAPLYQYSTASPHIAVGRVLALALADAKDRHPFG